MGKWEMVRLVDICDFQGGSQPPKEEWITQPQDGYIRMLQIRDFTQNREGKEEYVKNNKNIKTCDDSDILIARYGASVGKILTGLSGAYNVAIMKTIPDTKKLIKKYLRMFLLSNKFQDYIANVGSRAAQAGFNKSDLENLIIPLPPLETQKQIAKTLDTTAELLTLRKQQLAELDNLIKSTFYDMFGDPVTNEKGWSQCFINNFFDIIDGDRGVNYPKQDDFFDEGYCLFLNTGNVTKDGFNFDTVKFISIEKDKQLRKGKLERGDIVVTTRGTVGNIAYYNNLIPYDNIRINSGMVLLRRSMNKNISPVYFCELFKTNEMTREVKSFLSGTAQPQLPITNMKKIKFIIPPISLQSKFAEIVTKNEEQKVLVKKAIDETQHLFDSLMSEYFE